MTQNNETRITRDPSGKKLLIERKFDAPVEQVWKAWTDSQILDEWWAPHPFKTRTRSMDFRPGGKWLYAMEGPDGERHWCGMDYHSIVPGKSYEGKDYFTDENGVPSNEMPSMHWKNEFRASGDATIVYIEVSFETAADLEKIVEMGFKEGFTAAHGNLDEVLQRERKAVG
jgi:uncharacterized protein YndB with AHSA1/START domain